MRRLRKALRIPLRYSVPIVVCIGYPSEEQRDFKTLRQAMGDSCTSSACSRRRRCFVDGDFCTNIFRFKSGVDGRSSACFQSFHSLIIRQVNDAAYVRPPYAKYARVSRFPCSEPA